MTQSTLEMEKRKNDAIAHHKDALYTKPSMQALFEQQFSAISKHMASTKHLIELGCGTGDFLKRATDSLPIEKATGIELSPECVAIAQKRLTEKNHVHLCEGDAARMKDICTEPADTVLMRGVIHHLENPFTVFQKCHESLSPGGKIIIFEGNTTSAYRSIVLGLADIVGMEHEASQFPHTPPDDIRYMLGKVGFKNITLEFVPGLIAPLSYAGFGGKSFWDLAARINLLAGRVGRKFFGWWYLMTAEKGNLE